MKKAALLLLAVLGLAHAASAQVESKMSYNGYLSARAGVPFNFAHGMMGFGGGLSVGEWLMKPLAFQLSFDYDILSNHPSGNPENYLYASAEFIWEPLASIGSHNFNIGRVYDRLKHPLNLYFMIGLGGVACSGSDSVRGSSAFHDADLYGMLGTQLTYHATDHLALDLASRFVFYANGFDVNHGYWGGQGARVTLGATYNFSGDPYHRRPSHGSRQPEDDWFVGFGLGANYSSFAFDHFFDKGMLGQLGFAPELMIGKNYTNVWTIRFLIGGIRAHQPYNEADTTGGMGYNFTHIQADFMVNLMHLMNFKRGVRFNVLPYFGAGPIWRYDRPSLTFAADGGIMFRYSFDATGDFYTDLKYTMITPRQAGGMGASESQFAIGILSLNVGYIYSFGRSTTRFQRPVNELSF